MLSLIRISALGLAMGGAYGETCPKKELSAREEISLQVLVSFSMPLASLKALGNALKPLKGKLVFRGLYENSFQKTQKKLVALGCEAEIDPLVFKELSISHVPVFVVGYKRSQQKGFWVSGHISLRAALEKIAEKGVREAQELLDRAQRRP